MTFSMSFMPAFMLPMCRSVEIESGTKPVLIDRHGDAPEETAAAVADVEDDAALARLDESGIRLAGYQLVAQARVHVRVDVARPQLLRDEVRERPLVGVVVAEIDHHRNVRRRCRFDRALDRGPFRSGVVRGLDADDRPLVLLRHRRGRLRIHVGEVLLELPAAHPVADDVDEGQHARARAIDDARLEVLEVPPARPAGIGHRRDANAERETVGIHAVVAGIRAGLAGAGVDVGVDVDQAGRDVQPRDVNRLAGLGRVDFRRDERDLAGGDRHVADGVDAVPRVDDVAAAQEEVVLRRRLRPAGGGGGQQQHGGGRSRRSSRATLIMSRQPRRRPARRFAVHVALEVLAHVERARELVPATLPAKTNDSASPLLRR